MLQHNPFDVILERINGLSAQVEAIQVPRPEPPAEIIDRKELCKRLAITEPSAIRWEKKGKIPCIRLGGSVRYNWPKVIEALEKTKSL